jgi:threonine aldolase
MSTPRPIDLRSDTVTRPTPGMLRAMTSAELGDDVLGDDPTVIALQEKVAALLGKEAAVFVPTGTMANQTAIRAHTEPGDEVVCHEGSHIIHYETGSPAALSGVMVRPLPGERGLFEASDVDGAVRPESSHFARSRLLIVENTHNRGGGAVWPVGQVKRVTDRARAHGLRCHLDGARLWNACAATGLPPAEYAQYFDTVSVCFSKGLGTPAGSAVAGDKATMVRVHRFRKMFGGTMRQTGVLAAAALHALDHHRERLVEDHANATRLAEGLGDIPGLSIALPVETNMVFFDVAPSTGVDAAGLCAMLKSLGVLMLPTAARRIRAVCHLDVNAAQIAQAVERVAQALGARVAA